MNPNYLNELERQVRGLSLETIEFKTKNCLRSRVVVVGAGLAGLATAQKLKELGVEDVVVLEALGRVGGRVETVDLGDFVAELGAQWLHGADENPLYKWMSDEGLLEDFEDASKAFRASFRTSGGEEIEAKLVRKVLDLTVEIKNMFLQNMFKELIHKMGFKNAGEVLRYEFGVQTKKDQEFERNKDVVASLFEWFMRYEVIENGCDSMDQVSISSYTDWTDYGDGTLMNLKGGYRTLLDWFVARVPLGWIRLDSQVTKIELDGSKGVRVEYEDAETRGSPSKTTASIECDHVVVTSSLGFLKENHERLFKPPLPLEKSQLIDRVGFGTVNKIVLEFESCFWSNCGSGVKLVWKNKEEIDRFNYPSWVGDLISFDVLRRQPEVLIGWVGGRGAVEMESESDATIGEICVRLLDQFLPSGLSSSRSTKLVTCKCSRWHANRYVRGSYSFQSMRSFNLDMDKLLEPIYSQSPQSGEDRGVKTPRILFAGEATAGKLYSTAHGAIETGWREAERLKGHLSSVGETTTGGQLLPPQG